MSAPRLSAKDALVRGTEQPSLSPFIACPSLASTLAMSACEPDVPLNCNVSEQRDYMFPSPCSAPSSLLLPRSLVTHPPPSPSRHCRSQARTSPFPALSRPSLPLRRPLHTTVPCKILSVVRGCGASSGLVVGGSVLSCAIQGCLCLETIQPVL